MRVAIMQPYFFPYIGYFALLKHAEKFILFDPVQFITHGWIERNRILKQNSGWSYIKVPLVSHSHETIIKDLRIKKDEPWREKIFAQLVHYKKKANYYYKTIDVIKRALEIDTDSITELNKHILDVVCAYLGFNPDIEIFSNMGMNIDKPNAPDEWALNICKKIEGDVHYINPIGGLEFFERTKYQKSGIDISFMKMNIPKYSQNQETFEEGLSIIDIMMYNSVEQISVMLNDFTLE